MRQITMIILGLTCALHTNAQELKGYIFNTNAEPIKNAKINVLNSGKTALSDSSGLFTMEMQHGNYQVSIVAEGFAEQIEDILFQQRDSLYSFVLYKDDGQLLDPVIITANRREENLLKVATSVTSLSAEQIKNTRTWDLSNLNGLVPNYHYANLGVGYQQQIAIRGISIFSETPATNTYIDGVLALDVTGNGFQLMDVERIEILRGPQGTLYGRNAMGGVINITTKAPKNKQEGFAEISLGNQGLQRYGVGFKIPLIKNKLYFGATAQYQKYNGFYTNNLSDKTTFDGQPLKGTPEDGQRMGDEAIYYTNVFLKYIPNYNWTLTYNSKFQADQSIGASAYYQAVENPNIALNKPYEFAVNDLGSSSRKVWNNSLAIQHFGTKFNFTSTTALQYIAQAYSHIDQDLYPYDLAAGYTFSKKLGDATPNTIFSQEIRFSNPANNSRWQWQNGAYFFNQWFDKQYAAVYQDLGRLFGMEPGTQVTQTKMNNLGAALFAQVSYNITQELKATAGLRFDYEKRLTDVARYYWQEDGTRDYDIPPTALNSSYNTLSPKLSLQYELPKQHNLYLTYTRGFRAGGNNMFTQGKYPEYKPEYSDNFELGHKWQSANKKWMLTSSLFYLHWKDLQLDMRPEPGVWIVDNVGDVRSLGAEISLSATPVLGMLIDGAFGWNDARYLGFTYLDKDIKDNQAILAPTTTWYVGAQQYLPLSKKMLLLFRAEWRRMGNHYFDLANEIQQPAYNLFNVRTALSYKQFELALWVQNIADQKYIVFAMPGYFKHTVINRPRTFGITLSYNF